MEMEAGGRAVKKKRGSVLLETSFKKPPSIVRKLEKREPKCIQTQREEGRKKVQDRHLDQLRAPIRSERGRQDWRTCSSTSKKNHGQAEERQSCSDKEK